MLAELFSTMSILQAYAAGVVVMSLLTFGVYGWDKRAAQQNLSRVPEKTLHILALLCGWPGVIAGQKVFRHKTQKKLFLVITYAIIALHALGLAAVIWLNGKA